MWQNLIVILIGAGVFTYFLWRLIGVVRGGMPLSKCDCCSHSGCESALECPGDSNDYKEREDGPAVR